MINNGYLVKSHGNKQAEIFAFNNDYTHFINVPNSLWRLLKLKSFLHLSALSSIGLKDYRCWFTHWAM
jgi:hypothetical protein